MNICTTIIDEVEWMAYVGNGTFSKSAKNFASSLDLRLWAMHSYNKIIIVTYIVYNE